MNEKIFSTTLSTRNSLTFRIKGKNILGKSSSGNYSFSLGHVGRESLGNALSTQKLSQQDEIEKIRYFHCKPRNKLKTVI